MMNDDTDEGRVELEPGRSLNKDEFIKVSVEILTRLFDRATRGDIEALETLQLIDYVLTPAFLRTAPVGVQRALELRKLKWSLAQVVKPSPSSKNKKGSVFSGSIIINEKCEAHPLYAEAKKYAKARRTLQSLTREIFNARLEQEGRPTLEKSQFDEDEAQLNQWENEQRQNNPSYLHYAPPMPQNAHDLKEYSRKMFSGELHGTLADSGAIYSVEQTWRKRKTDKRRA
jgi:hypothetical protein